MNTKLTLRLQEKVIRKAKLVAHKRGKSVSQMVGEFFDTLDQQPVSQVSLPPLTASLVGILKGRAVTEEHYRKHLKAKHS